METPNTDPRERNRYEQAVATAWSVYELYIVVRVVPSEKVAQCGFPEICDRDICYARGASIQVISEKSMDRSYRVLTSLLAEEDDDASWTVDMPCRLQPIRKPIDPLSQKRRRGPPFA